MINYNFFFKKKGVKTKGNRKEIFGCDFGSGGDLFHKSFTCYIGFGRCDEPVVIIW